LRALSRSGRFSVSSAIPPWMSRRTTSDISRPFEHHGVSREGYRARFVVYIHW
jgi:hypothetical protein